LVIAPVLGSDRMHLVIRLSATKESPADHEIGGGSRVS
jgi:hypothetical protein